MTETIKHLLKLASLVLLWFCIAWIGLIITFLYGIWLGGFFVGVCYWLWVWGIKAIIRWYDS